jgi:protein O-GlcNAc transferase
MVEDSMSWSFGGTPAPKPAPDPLQLGVVAHRQGQLDQARTHYLEALRQRPNRALAAHHMGLLQIDSSLGMASLPYLLRALMLQPNSALFCQSLLYARLRSGRLSACEELLADCEQRQVQIELPQWRAWLASCHAGDDPSSLDLPSPRLIDPRDYPEADDASLVLPTQTSIHQRLAEPFTRVVNLYRAGRISELVDELDQLLAEYPDWGEGHDLNGLALIALKRLDDAAVALKRASELLPGRTEIWDHLGVASHQLDDDNAVIDACEHSIALNPLRAASWNNAAATALSRTQFEEAYQYAYAAVSLAPDDETFIVNFGCAARGIGNLDLAQRIFERVIQAHPGHAVAEQQLGELAMDAGDHSIAATHFHRVLRANPSDLDVQSNLIFLENYQGSASQSAIYRRARQYATLLEDQARQPKSWPNEPDPDRPLRIGFVSGDLRFHPVGQFFFAVVQQLAGSPELELYAYPTLRRGDELTSRIRSHIPHWIPIAGLSDDQASARIAADAIDILVDLSGHTGKHRLGVFARKPAPVQITWLGYFGTTGLTRIDYLIAGPWDIPNAEEAHYSEKIWRLPHTRLCFSRPSAEVAVAPLPAERTGNMTFGCFNNLKKINEPVIQLWTRILKSIPGARLMLKASQLDNEEVRAATTRRLQQAGLDSSRLILEGPSRFDRYLAAYQHVDIALDPFPYTGGTTTIQALWMGVPVLSLAGDRLLARQGESMLKALGMDEWIAASEMDYLNLALHHAGSIDVLRNLRAELRVRLEKSPLMDASRFAADLETAFRGMWGNWCQRAMQDGLSEFADSS